MVSNSYEGGSDPDGPVKVLVSPASALILIEMAEAACRNYKCENKTK
jgi:hypothetical protein